MQTYENNFIKIIIIILFYMKCFVLLCTIIKNNLIMKNADKFWMGVAMLSAIGIVAVVIHIFHIEKQYNKDKEQWKRDSLILVSKKFVIDSRVKNDSLMNELIREPWKLDSVSPEVKKEYLRKYKAIE